MTSVLIKTESHYVINRKTIKEAIDKTLHLKGVRSQTEVSVSIIGDRLMKDLNKKYRNIDETTDVLSFPLTEESDHEFVEVPDNILRLGDIIVSYPQARDEAIEENKLIDDKISELVIHGLLHLLGQHHD